MLPAPLSPQRGCSPQLQGGPHMARAPTSSDERRESYTTTSLPQLPTVMPHYTGHVVGASGGETDNNNDSVKAPITGVLDQIAATDTEAFKKICEKLKHCTGGRLDVLFLATLWVAANATLTTVPRVLGAVFDQVRDHMSSSITVAYTEYELYNGLLRLVREKAHAKESSGYKFSGQHEPIKSGKADTLPGGSFQFFSHNGTMFVLERQNNPTIKSVASPDRRTVISAEDHSSSKLIVRCFGHSNAPVLMLVADIRKQTVEGKQLGVTKMVAGSTNTTIERSKRPMSSIDLEPELKAKIIRDAERFFSEDSREFYEATSQPYRRACLHGPPGTGKTSISVAIASHFGVLLILTTLKGMDDKDLMGAFSRLPYKCVVLLEDVDCAGAEVLDRDAKGKGNDNGESAADPNAALEATQEVLFERLMAASASVRQSELDDIEFAHRCHNFEGNDRITGQPRAKVASKPSNPYKKVSLSALLNVIDGADAAEGCLLLMTTNCPEVLDKALLRAGRVDEEFKIDFATKVTAELTFKRIFGMDQRNVFKPETIDRFTEAFVAQFPSRSKICTAELAKYCGQYRNQPQKAVEEFADWLRPGNDKFAYRHEDLASMDDESDFNVPEDFDAALLETGPEDLADIVPDTAAPSVDVAAESSKWSSLGWLRGRNKPADFDSIRAELLASPGGSADHSTLYNAFTIQVLVDAVTREQAVSGQPQAVTPSTTQRGLTRIRPFTGIYAKLSRVVGRSGASDVAKNDIDRDDESESESTDNASLAIVSPRPFHDKMDMDLASDFLPHMSLTDNTAVDDSFPSALNASTDSLLTSQYTPSAFSEAPGPSVSIESNRSSVSSESLVPRSDSDNDSLRSYHIVGEDDGDVFYDSEE